MNYRVFTLKVFFFFLFLSSIAAQDLQFKKVENKTPDLSKEKTLYVVGYAHLDTQWNWDYTTTIGEYIPNTMHQNFKLFEKYPNYIFNFSGANRYRMMKEYYPEDYEKVKDFVKAGRWFPCGSSWEESDVNVPAPESLIRQILYGYKFFKNELGAESQEYMLPDCFGFPASLPSILAHCGLKGFSTQKLTWGSPIGIPFNIGVWEGLDGKTVTASLNPGDYTSKIELNLSLGRDWIDRVDLNGCKYNVFADYRYYGVGDMGGAPREDSVIWLEKSVAGNGPIHIISATADQLFKDLTAQQVARLPRYQGDLLLTEHSAGSITSQAYMKRWNRKNEILAAAAERASVTANWLGALSYPKEKLNNAWGLVLGGQFHDILPGTSIPKAYEYSWNDELIALNQFKSVLENSVGAISRGMDTRSKGIPLVVFNPLSIEREDLVEATVNFPQPSPSFIRVYNNQGQEVPSQIIENDKGKLKILFLAKLPSLAYAIYEVRKASSASVASGEMKVSSQSLENTYYQVEIDKNGDVSSIYDKKNGRQILSNPSKLAFLYEMPEEYPAWNMDWKDRKNPPRAYVTGQAKVSIVENGPARVSLKIERESENSKFVQYVRLTNGEPGQRVEFANQIDWHTKESSLKAVFPLTVSNSKATYNWDLGTVQRSNNDPGKYEVPSHQWIDLTDENSQYGVAILNDYKYGSDKPDNNTLRLTLLYTPGVSGKFARYQATQDHGKHEMLYSLVGHTGDWRKGNINWQACRMNQPLIAFETSAHPGILGKSLALLKVNNPAVSVMALKQAEESDEIIIRLQELNGMPVQNVQVSTLAPISTAREVTGVEKNLAQVNLQGGQLTFDLTPYQLRTFAIKLDKAPLPLIQTKSTPLDIPYDLDVISLNKNKADGNFDGEGRTIAGDMLPTEINSEGITFKLGPKEDNQKNALTCHGQSITLPAGKNKQLHILAAADGDTKDIFKIDGKPIELTIQAWGGFIGQWDTRIWKNDEYKKDPQIIEIKPAFIKSDPIAWFCSHRHQANGKDEIYAYSYLYKYNITLPPNAKTLTLPNNDKIRIMAITVAENSNDQVLTTQSFF